VFLSYNWSCKEQVKELDKKLTESGLKVWRDEKYLENNNTPLLSQITTAIRKSKLIVCCVSEKYCESHNCNLELEWANTLKKNLLVLMIDNIDFSKEIRVNGFNHESSVPIIIK
jgi:hypothetical protein